MNGRLVFLLGTLFLLVAAQAPPGSAYDAGVAARQAGKLDEAERLLGQAVAQSPENSDAHLQLGLTYLALGRLDEAEAEFTRTLELAPDYADARIGLARIAERRGRSAEGLRLLAPLGTSNAEAFELRNRLGTSPDLYQTRIDLDFGASAVEGQSDWREAILQLSHRFAPATALTARVEASRRFDQNDVFAEIRIDHRLGQRFSFWLSAGATPNADFRPRWQVGGGIATRLRDGNSPTVFTLDALQARYVTGDVQTLNPGVEQYFANGRAWVTLRWINLFDEGDDHRSGWLARTDFMAWQRLRLFVGAADAPDVSEGQVSESFALFGGLAADLSERAVLRLSVSHDDRDIGDRTTGSVGLGWRF